MAISRETAYDIACAYREIERAEELLSKVEDAISRYEDVDIRDDFGRKAGGLQLGIPSGASSTTLFNVPWSLARPVIQTHIAEQKAQLAALNEKAIAEARS
ncbi:MAG: hypothetical protein GOVbin52_80 [Prokaryotic dsDNA virus sp.]|nr:MAG: hypothetical protein GOVbin52_80 [Prokaryotic dsDNA virus sp.]|tara:strand:+ start:8468 stop:8770 length:303 start_codon:yes stop_codon:yes gene_type:complete